MATIKYIKDKDDNLVLPVTAPKAVIDEQGVNLETTLTNIKDKNTDITWIHSRYTGGLTNSQWSNFIKFLSCFKS